MKDSERNEVFARLNIMCRHLIDEANVLFEYINFMDDKEAISKKISAIENESDVEMHAIHFYYQNQSLLRDGEAMLIYDVIKAVEDCTDAIDDIGEAIIRFNVNKMTETMYTAIISSKDASYKVKELVNLIRNVEENRTPTKQIIELDGFKIEYKKSYDQAVKDLFTSEDDTIEVVRMLKIYDAFMDLFKSYELVSEMVGKYSIFMD